VAESYLIGIAGPSCAGKSELARWLGCRLAAPVLSLDSYYLDLAHLSYEERSKMNFDEPAALDHDLIAANLAGLARGEAIEKPVYDFTRHTRSGEVQRIEPAEYVIVEGLLAFHWPDIRDKLPLKVYVEIEDKVCFARRLERDVRERGRTPESVRLQYDGTVRPMAELYIWPTRQHANLVVRGDAPLGESGEAVVRLIESLPRTVQRESHG
jgi:uridine kinase